MIKKRNYNNKKSNFKNNKRKLTNKLIIKKEKSKSNNINFKLTKIL